MDWGSILGMGASAASGGLLGVFGAVFGAVSKHFQRKQEMQEKREERAHVLKLHELQMQARAAETEQEISLANAEGSWAGLEASHEADARIGESYPWVNAVRSLFRPFITLLLWAMAGLVFYAIRGNWLNEIMNADDRGALITYMVNTVVFCAATATLWWYSERGMQPPGLKNR